MSARHRVALVGPGFIATRHLEVLSSEPGVELVGILGRRTEPTAAAAARYGGRPYTELGALLDRERPDAVWLCLPPDAHGALELELIERGIHLFVEKPLAADAVTPERIADAIAARGVVAAVGYHWRALDTLPEVVAAIAGRPVRLATGAWHDSLPGPAWWRDAARGGGQIVEQATHLVDLARLLLGEGEVVAAAADRHDHADHPDATVADASAAIVRFERGALASFSATWVLGGTAAQELRLFADGLAISITQQGVTFEDGAVRAVTALDGFTGSRTRGVTASRYLPTGNDPFRDQTRAFLRAIERGDPSGPISTYADALRTHRLTTGIRAAAERPGG